MADEPEATVTILKSYDAFEALLVNGQLADSMSVVLAERGPHQPIDMMLVIAL
ncbi:hypothetical protein PF005_g31003 [Phytophthora fragariae]|uniref:Uncharacterized protein n=1 Tax=Phytophthora fragariae TaxID=53985 RepID=A0A6A3PG51_9STRA|nr:hypothetical protein PF003_g26476 [Phytophthora fragariae]KAE8954539.1 hypothetical protein PF011_g32072 [Phytophthora fragariae]KAE9055604.1 hypothetical protein PF010_g32090 [Phytophthora fragariae]KAE9055676.1 hypothetical protein PF006_g32893 [Phytophthora fragariae]KAE9162062.1 hypothetical protein PF005_g31003 [Phytophthora fragariae]